MNGPYADEQAAREDARRIAAQITGADAYADGITQANRALLKSAVTSAGVELGAYDKQALDYLADFDVATVAAIAGLISRAHTPAGFIALDQAWTETLLQAMAEDKWARVGQMITCPDCADGDGGKPCERHAPDDAWIEQFNEMARWLCFAAGLPVDDESGVTQ